MKYISKKYEKTLSDLAETLVRPERFGDLALQATVEFDSVSLCEPAKPGAGYYQPPTEAA